VEEVEEDEEEVVDLPVVEVVAAVASEGTNIIGFMTNHKVLEKIQILFSNGNRLLH
jgi:hypothetical protein